MAGAAAQNRYLPGLLRSLRPVGQNAFQPMNVEWTDEMAGLLRAAREDLGWSRLHLAAEAGLSERTIVDLENNRRSGEEGPLTPRKDTVRKLVAALHFEELADLAGVQLPARARGRLRREDQLTAAQTAEVEQFIDWILSRDGD